MSALGLVSGVHHRAYPQAPGVSFGPHAVVPGVSFSFQRHNFEFFFAGDIASDIRRGRI